MCVYMYQTEMQIRIFLQVATHPEMLAAILSVEALEDNEVLIIEGVRHVSRINDPRHKAIFEGIAKPNVVSEVRDHGFARIFTLSAMGRQTIVQFSERR